MGFLFTGGWRGNNKADKTTSEVAMRTDDLISMIGIWAVIPAAILILLMIWIFKKSKKGPDSGRE